jgi:hypothetical protein
VLYRDKSNSLSSSHSTSPSKVSDFTSIGDANARLGPYLNDSTIHAQGQGQQNFQD